VTDHREPSTRERILAGARRAFQRLGYAGTRVEDILLEANISRPTFYRVFRNRDEVFLEVSDEAVPRARSARERVLEGARETFGQLGYELTRVEDILEAAGISRPTFYRVFSSKHEAYEELDRIAVSYLQHALEQLGTADATARDHLELVIASYFEWRIGLRLCFDGKERREEPPGVTHARRTLLCGESDTEPARRMLIAGLLCAVDALASSWTAAPSLASDSVAERRAICTQLVLGALG